MACSPRRSTERGRPKILASSGARESSSSTSGCGVNDNEPRTISRRDRRGNPDLRARSTGGRSAERGSSQASSTAAIAATTERGRSRPSARSSTTRPSGGRRPRVSARSQQRCTGAPLRSKKQCVAASRSFTTRRSTFPAPRTCKPSWAGSSRSGRSSTARASSSTRPDRRWRISACAPRPTRTARRARRDRALGRQCILSAQILRELCDRLEEAKDFSHLASRASDLAEALAERALFEEADEWTRVAEARAAADDLKAQMTWRPIRARIHAPRGEFGDRRRAGARRRWRSPTQRTI